MNDELELNSEQREIWSGTFGDRYINRNQTIEEVNENFKKETGITVQSIFEDFFGKIPKNYSILELGCNVGVNISMLNKMGFGEITGIEINKKASDIASKNNPYAKIVNSSIEEFEAHQTYDIVFTAGVLIHINPDYLNFIIKKIVNLSREYIFGFEYFSEDLEEVKYRNQLNSCWRQNFPKLYLTSFPNLKIKKIKKIFYKETDLVDIAFLLQKVI